MGVFDFDEFHVGQFIIDPGKGDPPPGVPGIGIDGIASFTVKLVVMEDLEHQEIPFGCLIEDGQSFLGLVGPQPAELLLFLSGELLAPENLFCRLVGEAADHAFTVTQKENKARSFQDTSRRCGCGPLRFPPDPRSLQKRHLHLAELHFGALGLDRDLALGGGAWLRGDSGLLRQMKSNRIES